jgi:hypothetical protein
VETQKKAATTEPSFVSAFLRDHEAHSVSQLPLFPTEVGEMSYTNFTWKMEEQ